MAEEFEGIPVLYSNSMQFHVSLHDFSMLFGIMDPISNVGSKERGGPKKKVAKSVLVQPLARVVMSPTHFKRFVEISTQMLENYEASHGKIPRE